MDENLFWKVIHNKYLFNYIFNQIHSIEYKQQQQQKLDSFNEYQFCKKKFKYIISLYFMIIKKQYSLIMFKIKMGDFIEINSSSIVLIINKIINNYHDNNNNNNNNNEFEISFFQNLLTILLENKLIPKNLHYHLLPISSATTKEKSKIIIEFIINKIKNNDYYNINEMLCGGNGIDPFGDNDEDTEEDGGGGENLNFNQKEYLKQNFSCLFNYSNEYFVDLILNEFCLDKDGKIKKVYLDAIQDTSSNHYLISIISYNSNNNKGIVEYCFNHPQLKELIFPTTNQQQLPKMKISFNIKQLTKMEPIHLNKILDYYSFTGYSKKQFNSIFKIYKVFNSFEKFEIVFRIYYLYFNGANEEGEEGDIPDSVKKQIQLIKENENYNKIKELSKLFIQLLKNDKYYRYYLLKYDEAIKGINDQLVAEICIETLSCNLLNYLIDNNIKISQDQLKKRSNLSQLEVSMVHPIPVERIIKFISLYNSQDLIIFTNEFQEFKNLINSTTTTPLFSNKESAYYQLIKPWFDKYSNQEDILIKDQDTIDWISNNKCLYSITQKLIIKGHLYIESSKLVEYVLKKFENKINIAKYLLCANTYINAIVKCDIKELEYCDQIMIMGDDDDDDDNKRISIPFTPSIIKLTENLFKNQSNTNQELVQLINHLNQSGFKKCSFYLLQSILNKVIEYNNQDHHVGLLLDDHHQPLLVNFDTGIPFQLSIELLLVASLNLQFKMVKYILDNFKTLVSNLDKINQVYSKSSLKECQKIGVPTSREPETIDDISPDDVIKIVHLLLELYRKSQVNESTNTTTTTTTTKYIAIEKLINSIYYKFVQILGTTIQQIKILHNLIQEYGFKLVDNTSHFIVHYCRIKSLKLYKYIIENAHGIYINYNSKFPLKPTITSINNYFEYFFGINATPLDSIIELLFKSHIYYYKDGSFSTELPEEAQNEFDHHLNKDLSYLILVGRFDLLFSILESIKNEQEMLNQESIFQINQTFHQSLLKNFTLDIFDYFSNHFNDFEIFKKFIQSINIKRYSSTLLDSLLKYGRIDAIEYLIDNKYHTIENPKRYIKQAKNNNLFSVEQLLKNKFNL